MGERFDEQPWAPLADSTVESKSAAGLDPRILHATLALRESLTTGADGSFTVVNDNGLWFGTSIDYAKFHQKGTSRMPQRKVIEFNVANRRSFTREIQRYVARGEAGLVSGGARGLV